MVPGSARWFDSNAAWTAVIGGPGEEDNYKRERDRTKKEDADAVIGDFHISRGPFEVIWTGQYRASLDEDGAVYELLYTPVFPGLDPRERDWSTS